MLLSNQVPLGTVTNPILDDSLSLRDKIVSNSSLVKEEEEVGYQPLSVSLELQSRYSTLTNASKIASEGVSYSQFTNAALTEQNKILDEIKDQLLSVESGGISVDGIESIRRDIVEKLTTFDKIASDGEYNSLFYLQKSNSDTSTSEIQDYMISEFPKITLSTESIQSNSEGLGLTALKNISEGELTSTRADTEGTAVEDAIDMIEQFQSKYNQLQNNFKNSVNNLNDTSSKLTTPIDYDITINYGNESLTFDKNSILQQFGKITTAQANASAPTVMELLKL